ncbi:methyltransferase domain-containing protein [Streptomyces sp. NPDC002577]
MPFIQQAVQQASGRQAVARRRPACLRELAQGTDRFHEPRRTDCPWCGSERLRVRLRTTDLVQHKPGTFVLEECLDCSHAFQNPRLTPEGRAFYGRDAHDGPVLGARCDAKRYRGTARAMLPFGEPESWLDIGTGHARFPEAARDVHPYTAFDGLDEGAAVHEAVRAGRIEEGHRGSLAELAPRLAGRYDVLSMLHHLEHAADPREELAAARRVLRPGGHLLIEAVDPDSRYARLLGRWWASYVQPQHLHLIPLGNLLRGLEGLGYTVAAVDRRDAHVPLDLGTGVALALDQCLPAADQPWRSRPPSDLQRTVRAALSWAASPLVGAARAADHVLAPLASRTRFANAYRVIARRNEDGHPPSWAQR